MDLARVCSHHFAFPRLSRNTTGQSYDRTNHAINGAVPLDQTPVSRRAADVPPRRFLRTLLPKVYPAFGSTPSGRTLGILFFGDRCLGKRCAGFPRSEHESVPLRFLRSAWHQHALSGVDPRASARRPIPKATNVLYSNRVYQELADELELIAIIQLQLSLGI